MATLDDKILGEKMHYYCSSSEDEGEEDKEQSQEAAAAASASNGGGVATNTGPKGVIKDWQRYKQLEREEREEQEAEKMALAKRLAMTCRTDREDQEAKDREANVDAELEVMAFSLFSSHKLGRGLLQGFNVVKKSANTDNY